MIDPLKQARFAAIALKGPQAMLDEAVSRADAVTAKMADRVALRSEMKGHPYKDAVSDLAKAPLADLTEARASALSLIQSGQISRSDGDAQSREQLEEQAEALRTKIKSARAAIEERSIEGMEADLAQIEALIGEGDDKEDEEADGKADGSMADDIRSAEQELARAEAEAARLRRSLTNAEADVRDAKKELAELKKDAAGIKKQGMLYGAKFRMDGAKLDAILAKVDYIVRKDAFGITKLTQQQIHDLADLEDKAKGDLMQPHDRDRLMRLRKLKKHYEGNK